jgi:hypothetical protein
MKTTATIMLVIICAACSMSVQPTEVVTDTVIIHDTIYRDVSCYSCLDSIWQIKKNTLDSLWLEAIKEVDMYRKEAVDQVTDMRIELMKEKQKQYLDSVLIIKTN